jgi:hypothetical protein
MCRWPNGDLSFVFGHNKEDAITILDEWDNAEVAELRQIQDFMVDFRLAEDGSLELQAFGERTWDHIFDKAYPLLSAARQKVPTNHLGEATPDGAEMIRQAVKAETRRLDGKKKPKLADTELGRSMQKCLGAPAVLVNRAVKNAASETLKKLPISGHKQ